MFVWNFWREVCISGLQMAAQTASVVSETSPPTRSSVRPSKVISTDFVEAAALGAEVAGENFAALDVSALDAGSALSPRFVMHNPVVVGYSLSETLQSIISGVSSQWMHDAEVASCRISLRGNIDQISPNWDIVIGLNAEDCDQGGLMMALHPYYRHALLEKLDMLYEGMEADASFGIFTTRLRCQIANCEGGWRWFDVKLMAEACYGQPSCRAMFWDVHEQVMTEKELRTAHIEAELAQRGRYEFLGHMSHELRTPLNAMLGFAEMMEQGVMGQVENPHYKEYLANIRESGNLLLHRISDMVEIVNIEVGAVAVEDEQVQLNDWLQSAIRLHQHEATSRRVNIMIDGALPRILVYGDRVKLVRALGNIISNAVRFSMPDTQVRVACIKNAHGGITVAVHDSGMGMSENHLAMLRAALAERYCLFQQSPEAVSVGLGLAVAKEFLELHEGDLRIDSVKDAGTSVYIAVPTARVVSLETPVAGARRKMALNAS